LRIYYFFANTDRNVMVRTSHCSNCRSPNELQNGFTKLDKTEPLEKEYAERGYK
jgi:hypothetical protein